MELGLDNNRTAMLEAAAKPAAEQATYLRERKAPVVDQKAAQRQRLWTMWRRSMMMSGVSFTPRSVAGCRRWQPNRRPPTPPTPPDRVRARAD